jgi:hypothetical protein
MLGTADIFQKIDLQTGPLNRRIQVILLGRKGLGAHQVVQEVSMKHQLRDELRNVADVTPEPQNSTMDRTQRLERWLKLLEGNPHRILTALAGTEYYPSCERDQMRSDDSPFSVAFEDPVLRAEGLQNDTYGEAKRFFEVSDRQLHEIVCYCHVGHSMTAARAAQCVRDAIDGPVFLRLVKTVLGWCRST